MSGRKGEKIGLILINWNCSTTSSSSTSTFFNLSSSPLSTPSRPPLPPPPEGSSKNSRTGKFGSPERRVTDSLLVANGLVFLLQMLTRQRLTVWGAKINPAIKAGEWWRLLTPVLLHGNLLHLATNNFALNNLGPLTEQLSGHGRFVAVYVAAGVAGSLASFAFSPAPAVGASGAIFGVGGALAVFFYRHRNYFGKASDQILRQLGQSLALNVGMGFIVSNVDNWGEFFLKTFFGFFCSSFEKKDTHLSLSPKKRNFKNKKHTNQATAAASSEGP